MDTAPLPASPAELVGPDGALRAGKTLGPLPRPNYDALVTPPGAYARRFWRKRWVFATVATPEVLAGTAVVDLGYGANAFLYVLDRAAGDFAFEASVLGMPWHRARVGDRPLDAEFAGGGLEIRVADSTCGGWALAARAPGTDLEWDMVLERAAAPALSVVAPVAGRPGNATEKRGGMACWGTLALGSRRFDLEQGVAGTDFTHGYPPRHTTWRWAMAGGRLADGRRVGFNLVEGFNEVPASAATPGIDESALWIDDRLVPLPPARFTQEDDGTWSVRAGDLELRFVRTCGHEERRDLWLACSRFRQHAGDFSGSAPDGAGGALDLAGLSGVVEEQDVLW